MRLRFTLSARDFIARHDLRAAAQASNRLGRIIRLLTDQPELGQTVGGFQRQATS